MALLMFDEQIETDKYKCIKHVYHSNYCQRNLEYSSCEVGL
ncbi:hypothetical protein HDC92_001495 [Pedobacter sp. AK017]|nr:hypothetical protein [Pedobacter sp. AK017]